MIVLSKKAKKKKHPFHYSSCRDVSPMLSLSSCDNYAYLFSTAPSAPKFNDMTSISTTMTSIYVIWSQRQDDFVKGFNITSTYMGSCANYKNTTHISILDPSTRKLNITDLQENSNYSITITAYNDRGKNSSKFMTISTNSSGIWIYTNINF